MVPTAETQLLTWHVSGLPPAFHHYSIPKLWSIALEVVV
jgi:hypothetical protein